MNKKKKFEEIEEMKQVLVNYCMKHSLMFSFEALRKYCEVLHNTGYCRMPCKVGDTVYAVICPPEDDLDVYIRIDPCVESWQVCGLLLKNDKWYAENPDGEFLEIGTDLCMLTREEAERELERLEIHEK